MKLLYRVNGVERPEGEKRGLQSVTYGLDKKFYDSIEISIVTKRPRRKLGKRKKASPSADVPASADSSPVEDQALDREPNETLEQIEIFLVEKEAVVDEMRREHEKLVAEMNELKRRVSESQRRIEEAEFDILENREVVRVTIEGLEALNRLLAKRKATLQES